MAKKMGRPRKLVDIPDETILEALADAGGIWAHAARILRDRNVDVGRLTLRRHVEERPDLLERAREVKETAKDFAEAVLWASVQAGNGTDVRYFLSTQARDRGFGHQVDAKVTTHQKPEAAPGFIDFINTLSQDELRVLYCLGKRAQGRPDAGYDDWMVERGLLPSRIDNPHTSP